MKRALITLTIVLSSGSLAFAQELSCESHHDGDAIVSECTYGDHRTVSRCDANGCSSSSSNDAAAHISDATYRKLCQDWMSSAALNWQSGFGWRSPEWPHMRCCRKY